MSLPKGSGMRVEGSLVFSVSGLTGVKHEFANEILRGRGEFKAKKTRVVPNRCRIAFCGEGVIPIIASYQLTNFVRF